MFRVHEYYFINISPVETDSLSDITLCVTGVTLDRKLLTNDPLCIKWMQGHFSPSANNLKPQIPQKLICNRFVILYCQSETTTLPKALFKNHSFVILNLQVLSSARSTLKNRHWFELHPWQKSRAFSIFQKAEHRL